MNWYYYRKKEIDPTSLAHLERLKNTELNKRKKVFEKKIKEISNVFDEKKFNKLSKNIPLTKLRDEEKKITEYVKKSISCLKVEYKYYAIKGFLGKFKDPKIIINVSCENSKFSKEFLNKFKKYIDLIFSYKKISEENLSFNLNIKEFLRNLSGVKDLGYLIDSEFQNENSFKILAIFETSKINLTNIYGNKLNLHNNTYIGDPFENIKSTPFRPLRLKSDPYWSQALELTKKEYYDEKFESTEQQIYLIGDFFKNIYSISKKLNYIYLNQVMSYEKFRYYKDKLLDHFNKYLRKSTLVQRSRTREKRISETLNYVYVLSNKSYPGIFKIGWTSNLPEERAEQLSAETGVIYPFKVEFHKQFKNAEKIEKKIHRKFKLSRLRNNKEFFKINIKIVKNYINEIDER